MPNPRRGLKKKTYKGLKVYERRVLNFNPKEVYDRVKIDPYKRTQSVPMAKMFPKPDKKICSCGCGRKLTGKRRRWATDQCQQFAYSVNAIINGRSEVITHFLKLYFGEWACKSCGLMDVYTEFNNGMIVDDIHKDHIVAVANGGGGCWLSNYQLLCKSCHKEKTKDDIRKTKNKSKRRKVRRTRKKRVRK